MYKTKIIQKNDQTAIDQIQDWMWPETDVETWHGIRDDWVKSHHQKYFEYLDNNRVVIQAGGSCGMYPRLLAQYFKTVYTFEPCPLPFHCLVNNNQLEKVIKMQIALGDRNGQTAVTFVPNSVGISHVNEEVKGMIPMMTLDSFNFQDVDLICLDTEGYEGKILRGALQTIDKWQPVIIVENPRGYQDELLYPRGYKLVDRTGHGDKIFKVMK